jgi:transposase
VRDVDLYSQLLGLDSLWSVARVDLEIDLLEIHVHLEHSFSLGCPSCGLVCPVYDHGEERTWRDLDTHRCTTLVHARLPRVNCQEHGIQTVKIPWSDPHSRYTRLFESQIIRLLEMTKCQVRTARFMGLSERQVHLVMQRAVKRGLRRREAVPIRRLGLDEKSFHKGHVYASVLSDLDGKRVLDIELGRTFESTCVLLERGISFPQAVTCISLDMWQAFTSASLAVFPHADVVHDRFHVAKYLCDAVDMTRRREHNKRIRHGDWSLEHSRFLWIKNRENHTPKQALRFEALLSAELETGKAWALKETFKAFFSCSTLDEGTAFLENWTREVERSKNCNLIKVAKMLGRYKQGLLAYITHKVTNAQTEALNSMIQEIKTIARGFRRFENFKVAILFFLGKLNLNPH